MNLLSLSEVSFGYGPYALLENACLGVERGDRLALTGPNGCGKSTLLKIISGELTADSGLVERINGLKTACLPQEVPDNLSGDVFSIVAKGLGKAGEDLVNFRNGIHGEHSDESELWNVEAKVSATLEKLELKPDLDASKISAGLKRRALLGASLVSNPDLLMLDEPTNHLDISSVVWLENFLLNCGKTLIFVSHDRAFLNKLATRVVEVDRGRLISFACGFDEFTKRRDDYLEAQQRNDAEFDKKLKKEEAWLRRGIRARRTRNEGRVKELMKLRQVRADRRERKGVVESFEVGATTSTGQKVFDIKNLSISFGDRKIIDDFTTTIYRGDKIGIIGPNGVGKTTLVKLILGQLKPDHGSVEFGTKIQLAYFDQLRERLDPKMRPFDFVGESSDYVNTAKGSQNVMGYLQNFLFTPDQILGKISMLSGGERNRLMLAKLLASPANVLVLDEPTNDLDMETMEILEDALIEFQGTILLVSHDRTFLNNTTTAVFGFAGDGKIVELAGGYDEWARYKEKTATPEAPKEKPTRPAPIKREKFTNKEREELAGIQGKIEENEAEQNDIASKMENADFVREHALELAKYSARYEELKRLDDALIERWTELEEKRERIENQK